MPGPPIITLTTDFRTADGFPAAMKGVIAGLAPGVRVVDLTHDVPPQDIAHASFVIGSVAQYFPAGTVHVAVVDPGVGTARRALAIRSPDGTTLVGPDNGVFSHLLAATGAIGPGSHERELLAPYEAELGRWHEACFVENPDYMLPDVSATFHGRDVFAPAAAHLALGVPVGELGPPVSTLTVLNLPGPRDTPQGLAGRVQYRDGFGNLATDIPARAAAEGGRRVLRVRGRDVPVTTGAYADAGELGVVAASHGYLEITAYRRSAAAVLGAAVGDEVTLAD